LKLDYLKQNWSSTQAAVLIEIRGISVKKVLEIFEKLFSPRERDFRKLEEHFTKISKKKRLKKHCFLRRRRISF